MSNKHIFHMYNVLSDASCNLLIDYLQEQIKGNKHGVEDWGEKTNVKCKFIHLERTIFEKDLYNVIGGMIDMFYHKHRILCRGDSGYCLRRIEGATRNHVDGILVEKLIDKDLISIHKIRKLSVIICLNDDYEGSEFYFPAQEYKIKLKKGEAIAFPPYWTHPHEVSAPENGTFRYTINTWLYE